MKKYFILISLILSINNSLLPVNNTRINSINDNKTDNNIKKTISFVSIVDFWANPFIFEPKYSNGSNSFNGRIMFGLKYNKFTYGLSMFENYFSTGQNDGNADFFGAVNIFRWNFDFFYSPIDWIDIRAGVGFSLSISSYVYKYQYNDIKYDPGIFILYDMRFLLPIKFIEFQLLNRLDIFFDGINAIPRYTGSGRFIVHPYFSWIGLYIEAGGETFLQKSANINVVSGYFVWSVGIQFELNVDGMKKEFVILNKDIENFKNKKGVFKNNVKEIIVDTTSDVFIENDAYVATTDTTVDSIKKLLTAEVGDVVEFNNILFYSDHDKIKEESLPILNEIAEILIKRENIVIEVGGYTNSVGRFEEELELSMKRALKVAIYLSSRGVNINRIKATGYGGIKGEGAAENKRKVEIKILKYQ